MKYKEVQAMPNSLETGKRPDRPDGPWKLIEICTIKIWKKYWFI